MNARTLAFVLTCCPLLAAAGEDATTSDKREVNASLQMVAPLPFLTPRDARGEGVTLAIAGGKAKLSLPVKDGGVTVFYARGSAAVVPGDAAGTGNAVTLVVPKEGFSPALALDLPCADGSTSKVVLAFARGKDDSELLCRNLAVAVTQTGGCTVYVVDDNCNGKYNDVGEDAIIVNAGRLAAPLSPTIMLGAVPHKLEVAENGKKMTFTPAPAKVGAAGLVSEAAYGATLAGAVLKGPDGSFFALAPNMTVPLPVGGYSLAFASLADAAGRKAIIKDGTMKVTVTEGSTPTAIRLGLPRLRLTAKVDAKAQNVTISTAGAEGAECDGGKITYLFSTPQADIRFINQSRAAKQIVGALKVSMDAKDFSTTFSPNNYGMAWGGNYLAEMTWPVGVGPMPTSSVKLKLTGR